MPEKKVPRAYHAKQVGLVRALRNRWREECKELHDQLFENTEEPTPSLEKLISDARKILKNSNTAHRIAAAGFLYDAVEKSESYLGRIDSVIKPAQQDLLRVLSSSRQKSIKRAIVKSLSAFATPTATHIVEAMIQVAKDNSGALRIEALDVIQACAPDAAGEAVPAMIDLLRENDNELRKRICDTIAAIGRDAGLAVPELITLAVSGETTDVKDAAVRALIMLDEKGVQVADVVQSKQAESVIIRVLREFGDDGRSLREKVRDLPPISVAYLGDGRIRVGDGAEANIIRLDEAEKVVLGALVELQAANKKELIAKSKKENAPRILASMRRKYPFLKPQIDCPGARGKGGYSTTIRREPQ